jgi:predicted HicB family RNase H-like nuclease
MTAHGWELLDLLKVMVVNADKGHWINAARQSGCGLEQWVNKTLNEAAAKYPLKR